MKYKTFLLFIIILFLMPSISLARCPINALNIKLTSKINLDGKRLYAEIKDKLGTNRIVLKKEADGNYKGTLSFITSGITIFVELNCTYFPKYLTIYLDDKAVQKIRLKINELKSYLSNDRKIMIYDVKVNLVE